MIPSIFEKTTSNEKFRGIVVMTDAKEENQYGRIKIKVWGVYPDDVKSEELPWAWPETPGIIGGKFQTGWSSVPEEGSIVSLYFDYGDINVPIYTGTVPGLQHKPKGDTYDNTVAVYGKKNDKTLLDKKDGHRQDFHRLALSAPIIDYDSKLDERWVPCEESPEFSGEEDKWKISWKKQHENVVYPFNHVFSTGRHTIEYDNTDGYERLSFGHWMGSHITLDWEGDLISKAFNNQWKIADENSIEWTKYNKTLMTTNSVQMIDDDNILFVGGSTAQYYGKRGKHDFNYEGKRIFSEVSTKDGEEDAKTYLDFNGNLEYKLHDGWIIEVLKSYHLNIVEDLHTCVGGNAMVTVAADYDVSSSGTMNFDAPLIKLNCGGAKTAVCPSPEDPILNGVPSDPDKKEQGFQSQLKNKNKALVDMINKEVGAKCQLLETGDVAG